MFQDRLAALEGAEACLATATGMSAVFYALLALLKAGDRIVAARQLFGSCFFIINDLLPKYGIKGEFVDGGDLAQWAADVALARVGLEIEIAPSVTGP